MQAELNQDELLAVVSFGIDLPLPSLILTQIKEIYTNVTASSNDNVSNELSVIEDSLTVIEGNFTTFGDEIFTLLRQQEERLHQHVHAASSQIIVKMELLLVDTSDIYRLCQLIVIPLRD